MIRYDDYEKAIVVDYAKDKSIQFGWEWAFNDFNTEIMIGVQLGNLCTLNLFTEKTQSVSKSYYIYVLVGCIQIFSKHDKPMSDEYYKENMREGAL